MKKLKHFEPGHIYAYGDRIEEKGERLICRFPHIARETIEPEKWQKEDEK